MAYITMFVNMLYYRHFCFINTTVIYKFIAFLVFTYNIHTNHSSSLHSVFTVKNIQ